MAVSNWLRKGHVGPDRRADCRTICTGDTIIDVLGSQKQLSVPAHILDVGNSSLKLSVPFFLSPGSLLRIHLSDAVAEAEVRHCTCEVSGYHIGVQVEEIVPKGR